MPVKSSELGHIVDQVNLCNVHSTTIPAESSKFGHIVDQIDFLYKV